MGCPRGRQGACSRPAGAAGACRLNPVTSSRFALGDLPVEVTFKKVRGLRLVVTPPDGGVRISAPRRASLDAVRAFALAKLDWIERQRARILARTRAAWRDYADGETHAVWGEAHSLAVIETAGRPAVVRTAGRLELHVRAGSDRDRRRALLERWYGNQVAAALPPLVAHWQERLGVRAARVSVRRMKTRWGSCTPSTRTLRINAELATRSPSALEYIVVHELVHLLEASHGARFVALMDRHLPAWRHARRELRRTPP